MTSPRKPGDGRNGRWVLLGEAGVDSASLAICDPAFVSDADRDRRDIPDGQHGGPFSVMGVQFMSGFGDGGYEVWGWIVDYGEGNHVDERVAQVVVTMIDADDLAEWREMP